MQLRKARRGVRGCKWGDYFLVTIFFYLTETTTPGRSIQSAHSQVAVFSAQRFLVWREINRGDWIGWRASTHTHTHTWVGGWRWSRRDRNWGPGAG